MQKGLFITFEGSEGCGKSTQVRYLVERLEKLGIPFFVTREPGGTALGEEIRHLLKFSPAGKGMQPEAELLLFAASRAQLVREKIEPALERGEIVITDRFFDSTTVYQGAARQVAAEQVEAINQFAVDGCIPDITFLMDLDQETAKMRLLRRPRPVGEKEDRMEQEPSGFYEAVRQGYLALAAREGKRFYVVDAARPVAEIEQQIWNELQQRFHGFFENRSV